MQGNPHKRQNQPSGDRTHQSKAAPAPQRKNSKSKNSQTSVLRNAPAEPGRMLNREAEAQYRKEQHEKQQALSVRAAGAVREANPKVQTVRAKVKKPFPFAALFLTLVCSVLAFFVIYNSVRLSEYRSHVLEVQSQVKELEQQQKDLQLQLDKKNDLLLIEKYAISFGMVRTDQLTQYYITISGDDTIEIYRSLDFHD